MWLRAISTGHPAAPLLQPTWHCVERFRQRSRQPIGTEALLDALQTILETAEITAQQPPGVRYQQAWDLWALSDTLAFPLIEDNGIWIVPTCLARRLTRY
jgi:hypothetical protein